MRNGMVTVALLGFLAAVAPGQTSGTQKILRFANIGTPEGYMAMSTAIRAITEISSAAPDAAARTLTVSGTEGQLATAEWIFQKLDRASGANDPQITDEFPVPGTPGDVARIFVLQHAAESRQVQEAINAIRSIVEVRHAAAFSNAIVTRGTHAELKHVAWLVEALDRGPSDPSSTIATAGYDLNEVGERSPAVRIFYIRHLATPQAMQELVNAIRSVAEVQRIVPLSGPRAVVARASADQIALADWMISELDRPAELVTHKFVSRLQVRPFGPRDTANEVRVISVPQATPQTLQALVNQIRSTAQIQRLVFNQWRTALVMRATFQQVTEAERMIDERAK